MNSGYSMPSREDDPVHTVRAIGRMAQMILELRNDYVQRPRRDTLEQIDERLTDLLGLREQLHERMTHAPVEE
jgi:predicted N-formylglutamate amidohydrolase